ncbi:MAG: AMP-binding enzyme, partial [Candidatus Binatia bacterium]
GVTGTLEIRGESRALAVGGGEGGRPPARVSGEWCETGDVVSVGDDGRMRFLGRSDDRIKVRGRFVHPADVERRMLLVEGVAECMVTAEVDERGLPVLVARIVVADGALAEGVTAGAWKLCRARFEAHEIPGRVEVVAELPRSARGKLLRPRAAAGRR